MVRIFYAGILGNFFGAKLGHYPRLGDKAGLPSPGFVQNPRGKGVRKNRGSPRFSGPAFPRRLLPRYTEASEP